MSSSNMYQNDLLQVLDEADMISECIDKMKSVSENEQHASLQHQTNTGRSSLLPNDISGAKIYEKPLRPLSAYNIFFQLQRERILNCSENNMIPFSIHDMERVVRERYQNYAGIAPTTADVVVASSSKWNNNNKKIVQPPSFSELSRQVGASWRKLDKDTKNLIESFAAEQKLEYNKIHGIPTSIKRRKSIPTTASSVSSASASTLQQKQIPCGSSLNEVSTISETRSTITALALVPPPISNVATNNNTKSQNMMNSIQSMIRQIYLTDKLDDYDVSSSQENLYKMLGKQYEINAVSYSDVATSQKKSRTLHNNFMEPNLNMMMNHNRQMNILQQGNNSDIMIVQQQYRFRMWKQYQATMWNQYDSMMTESLMNDFQNNSQHCMMQQYQDIDADVDDDDDITMDALSQEQDDENYNINMNYDINMNCNNMNNYYHAVSSCSLLPDVGDGDHVTTCCDFDNNKNDNNATLDNHYNINNDSHHTLLQQQLPNNVSEHDSSLLFNQEFKTQQHNDDDDDDGESIYESYWDF